MTEILNDFAEHSARPAAPPSGTERPAVSSDPRNETLVRWTRALVDHDDAEIERLVRRSRADRDARVSSGLPDPLLGAAAHVPGKAVIP